jgi:hypothetical protein
MSCFGSWLAGNPQFQRRYSQAVAQAQMPRRPVMVGEDLRVVVKPNQTSSRCITQLRFNLSSTEPDVQVSHGEWEIDKTGQEPDRQAGTGRSETHSQLPLWDCRRPHLGAGQRAGPTSPVLPAVPVLQIRRQTWNVNLVPWNLSHQFAVP